MSITSKQLSSQKNKTKQKQKKGKKRERERERERERRTKKERNPFLISQKQTIKNSQHVLLVK